MGGDLNQIARHKSEYPQLAAHPVGQWIPQIYKERISQFYSGGQYEHKNLRG